VSQYQKEETNMDFTEARDSEWQWRQLGHMQVCTLLQSDNHASTPPLSFLQAGCPSCCPTNSVKALRTFCLYYQTELNWLFMDSLLQSSCIGITSGRIINDVVYLLLWCAELGTFCHQRYKLHFSFSYNNFVKIILTVITKAILPKHSQQYKKNLNLVFFYKSQSVSYLNLFFL